ncbi:MAG: ABC transporter permease, partial [Clostridia bacterium]
DQYTQNLAILSSVTSIFTVMAGAALGLAFVITYNMGILNFAERLREYATLKVLGYHQKEIRHLIMRESILVALLGTLVGIGPGIWLTRIIMVSCETEQLVYGVHVTVPSIVIASVITFGFACLVQLLLTRKVRRIDMVESLKSVE